METFFGIFGHKFETGEVRTSDRDIENFLDSIIYVEYYISFISSDIEELNKKMDDIRDRVTWGKANLDKFLNNFSDYTIPEIVDAIHATIDDILQILNDAKLKETDATKKCTVFPKTYRKLLNIASVVIAIENSKYNQCNHEYVDTKNGVYSIGWELTRYRCKYCGQAKSERREWDDDEWGGYSESQWEMLTR